jgi:hypothetical protein
VPCVAAFLPKGRKRRRALSASLRIAEAVLTPPWWLDSLAPLAEGPHARMTLRRRQLTLRQLTLVVVGLGICLPPAVGTAKDCQKRIELHQAQGGFFMEAKGTAEVAARGDRETFTVSVNVPVPDGVPFRVIADSQLTGTIVMAGGTGELQLSSEGTRSLPAALKPVCSKITAVRVMTPGGGVILDGRF